MGTLLQCLRVCHVRVCPTQKAARAGEVVVSEKVYQYVKGFSEMERVDNGPGPVLYKVPPPPLFGSRGVCEPRVCVCVCVNEDFIIQPRQSRSQNDIETVCTLCVLIVCV